MVHHVAAALTLDAAALSLHTLKTAAQDINGGGVARMCHALAVLQPALASLGAGSGAPHPEASRGFDHARTYYALLTSPADSLVKAAAERPLRFTPAEYLALLQVRPFQNTLFIVIISR